MGYLLWFVCISIACSLSAASHSFPLEEEPPSYCAQLGCDEAGKFTQDGFVLPMKGNMSVAWKLDQVMSDGLNEQNINYGCVGSSNVIACPFRDSMSTRHIMIDPATGTQYDTSTYDTLINVTLPILTEDNLIFAINSSHVSLVDPLNNRSHIASLPVQYTAGVHSPVYLPKLGFLVVFGNLSETQAIYKIETDLLTGLSELNLLTTFTVAKIGKPCPWLPFSEGSANGNRVFFYGVQRDEITGIVALDFASKAPYYKKGWELSDESMGLHLPIKSNSQSIDGKLNCSFTPELDPDYSIFPPTDVSTQMLATSDGYVVITSAIGLLAIKDHGDSGEQIFINLFGAHFLSQDTTPMVRGKSPIVWMTGWRQYPPFRANLIAFNYTESDNPTTDAIWSIAFPQFLGAADFNVTSRIASFPDSTHNSSKLLVFGVSVNTTSSSAPFHKLYCSECKPGINKMLMAIRSSPVNTETPDILWMARVPSPDWEVRGQIIGVGDKLITLLTDGHSGNIVAFK